MLAEREPVAAPKPPAWWKRLRPEAMFLLLGLPFGLAVLCANPPFQAPDEPDHFFRAFQLSDGAVLGERHGTSAGGRIPFLAMATADTEGIAFHPEKKMTRAIFEKKLKPPFIDWSKEPYGYCHFPHTVYYPPIGYVPQSTALALGKLAHLGPLPLVYLARLAVFGIYACLGWAALRRLPAFRWTALLFLLAPMSLYLMGSIATDAVLIGSAFLLVALTLGLATNSVPPARRELILLLALGCMLATTKVVYFPLAAAATVMAGIRLPTTRARIWLGVAFLAVCVFPGYLWGRVAADMYAPGRTDIPIDPVAQSRHMLSHPFAFLGLVVRTIRADASGIYEWFVGTLGWGDTPLPHWYYRVFSLGMVVCLIAESRFAPKLSWFDRSLCLAGSLVAGLLIFAAQYVTWNAPGSENTIDGICGRYFLPIVAFLVPCMPALPRLRVPASLAPVLGVALAALGCVVCLTAVIQRYYLG